MHFWLIFSLVAAGSSDPCVDTGPGACEIPAFIHQLQASYATAGGRTVDRLAQIGAPAIPALLAVLNDRTPPSLKGVEHPARYQAAFALAYMGKPAQPAISELLAVLLDRADDD